MKFSPTAFGRQSIRGRMFFALMLVVLAVILTVNFVMFQLIGEITERDTLRSMENSVLSFHRYDEQRQELLLTQARSMAQAALLKATLEIEGVDRETLAFAGEQLLPIADPELLLILDATGCLLVDVTEGHKPPASLDQNLGIEQALAGQEYYGIWDYEGANYYIAIAPSIVGNRIAGLIVLGERLDSPEAMQLLTEITGSKLALSFGNRSQSAAVESVPGDDGIGGRLLSALNRQEGETKLITEGVEVRKLVIAGDSHFTATIEYPSVSGVILLYRSINLMASALWPFQLIVLASSAIILLFGLLMSHWITTRISRPISKLTEVTKEYGKGNFELRLQPESEDEVGVLTNSFNAMAEDVAATRERLIESKELAEAANVAKSEFLATMSHEIRTPMNGVMGTAELLSLTELDGTQKKYIDILMSSSKNLLGIVNDILDFSKVESGKMQLEEVAFDLRELLAKLAESFSSSASKKALELVFLIPPQETLMVVGDPGRLNQVLTNLLGNAIKFTDEGVVQLEVILEEDSSLLRFEVSDTGIGVDSDLQEVIFNSFAQADNSTTRKYGGTGLGLAISRKIVQLMGGSIGFEAAREIGALIWFTAPLPSVQAVESAIPGPESPMIGLRALIVDDNDSVRKILSQQFDLWGLESRAASSAREALTLMRSAVAQKSEFDLVVVDKDMPDVDGSTLVCSMLAEFESAEHKFLLLDSLRTGCGNELLENGLSVHCLSKPIFQSALLECLIVMLDESKRSEEPREEPPERALCPASSELTPAAKILVIDDNELNLNLMSINLEMLGCNVRVVDSGAEGISAIKHNSYDLVFMDCQMPDMDGFDTTSRIRELERSSSSPTRLPIIALTGNAIKGDREKCLEAGMDDYLSKPFRQHELAAVLMRWLSKNDCSPELVSAGIAAAQN